LIAFIEAASRVQERTTDADRIALRTIMGKRTLADLANNDQVEIKMVTGAGV
jgi:hypothetical protein